MIPSPAKPTLSAIPSTLGFEPTLPPYLDGLTLSLFLGAYAEVERNPLRSTAGAVAVGANH